MRRMHKDLDRKSATHHKSRFGFLCSVLSVFIMSHINAQELVSEGNHELPTEVLDAVDTLTNKISDIPEYGIFIVNQDRQGVVVDPDSIGQDLFALKNALLQRIDSLIAFGVHSDSLQGELQTLLNGPQLKLDSLLAFQDHLKKRLDDNVSTPDTLRHLQAILKKKADTINEISTEVGVGPIGDDLMPNLNVPASGFDLSRDLEINTDNLPRSSGMDVIGGVLSPDIDRPAVRLSESLSESTMKVTDIVKETGNITEEAQEYQSDLKDLPDSKELDALAEKEALRIDELKAFKEQNKGHEEAEAYEKLIERYKNEKKIQEEMKAKVKELANDVVMQNRPKVDDTMKKISKYKRKFSDVPDMRNLPRRAPNPMKDLPFRERLVPGLTFQTVNNEKVWLELDPQVYYKWKGSWSVGLGGMYRFSVNADNIAFGDFGRMYGGKTFVQYTAFKSFFVRGELQFVKWKPWRWSLSDPLYVEETYVGAAGIGKGYMLTKRIKGSVQTLYHWHWKGANPYRPKIMIRLGFDFTLKKRKAKPWEEQLRAIKNGK